MKLRIAACVCGIAAFFERGDLRIDCQATRFERRSEAEDQFRIHFCPTCGTTLYRETGARPDLVAIADGAFADPEFPAPSGSHFDMHRYPWLRFPFD